MDANTPRGAAETKGTLGANAIGKAALIHYGDLRGQGPDWFVGTKRHQFWKGLRGRSSVVHSGGSDPHTDGNSCRQRSRHTPLHAGMGPSGLVVPGAQDR